MVLPTPGGPIINTLVASSTKRNVASSSMVFLSTDGWAEKTLSGAFERAAKAAGLPAIGIDGLRHSHASLGLASGVPLVIMRESLGHSSVAITGGVYSHSLPNRSTFFCHPRQKPEALGRRKKTADLTAKEPESRLRETGSDLDFPCVGLGRFELPTS
jgi:hypothetical protein